VSGEELHLADLNQDLLLAALALLTDTVPRDILRTSLLKWARNPHRSVAELLREQGVIDEGRLQALQCLVSAHLRNHNGNLQLSLDAWNAQAITQDMLTEIENEEPGTTLGATLAATLAPTAIGLAANGSEPATTYRLPGFAQNERFELIKPHAKGGIGQVWLARDRELQREVAVKEIQARYVDREGLKARFLLEAEITGKLEHPGIVPVYSLGRNASGRLYYAMRFIRGETLSAAIKRFHEARLAATESTGGRPRTTWGIDFQQLLRRFLDVCDAVEYAHSRGVIHRDIKPGNIMLGEYGETLVVDWGLAKRIGKTDVVAEHCESQQETDFEDGASVGGETQPGTTIGTPSYMSPEQARGALEDLGPTSDVYSLGATLYELLTGAFPFAAENAAKIIAKVKSGELIQPRVLVPSIPPQLEAICLKAMAFQPAQRYQSARELALDLEHWVADEPVTAAPEGPLQKVARWLRRHRSWTYAAAAALLGITLVATFAVFVVDRARRGEESARKEAEGNFKLAQQAVDNYLTNVSENTLFKEQDTLDIRDLRRDLLQSALPFYKQFLQQRSHDPQLREQLANAYFRLGEITRVIGTSQEAIEHYRLAQDLWEPLSRDQPDHLEFQHRLADCYFAMGKLRESDNLPEGLGWQGKALQIYERLAALDPNDPRLQANVAECCSQMAICYSKSQDPKKCLDYLEKARDIQIKLVDRNPSVIDYRKGLAEIINRKGYFFYDRGEYGTAFSTFEEFQRLCIQILAEERGPSPLRMQNMLAKSYYNIAMMHLQQSRPKLALEALQKAEIYWTRLSSLHSTVRSYRFDLSTVYMRIADSEHRLGHAPEAMANINKAMDLFDQLVKDEPDNLEYRFNQAFSTNLKACIHDDARRNDLALPLFEETVLQRRQILERSMRTDTSKEELCLGLENLGETYVDMGRVNEGLPHYQEAVEIRQALLAAHPGDLNYTTVLAEALIKIGDIERQAADLGNADRSYDRARAILEPREARDSASPIALADVLNRKASLLAEFGQLDQSLSLLGRAANLARTTLKTTADDIKARRVLSESLWEQARLLRARRRKAEANATDEQRATLWVDRPTDGLVDLATSHAARANLVGYGKTPVPQAGQRARELDRDQASADLQLAIAKGFTHIHSLRDNLDLGPLLDRQDLRSVLEHRNSQNIPAGHN
jgi:serine/threonine-protein kinase